MIEIYRLRCARCGKAESPGDGSLFWSGASRSGRNVHANPFICIQHLQTENATLKAKLEKQDAIIERLSDQYTDAVLAAEEMERE